MLQYEAIVPPKSDIQSNLGASQCLLDMLSEAEEWLGRRAHRRVMKDIRLVAAWWKANPSPQKYRAHSAASLRTPSHHGHTTGAKRHLLGLPALDINHAAAPSHTRP